MVNFRRFNGSTDVVTLSLGGLSTMTFGTVAVLCRRSDETTWDGAFVTRTSGATPELYIDIAPSGSSNFLWYNFASAANAGVVVNSANDWVWTIINKASGSVAPRTHKLVMSTGVWTRANGAALGDATSPSGGDLQIGNAGGDFFTGDIAAVAVWTTSLADAVLDGMVNSWPAVLAANPQAAWLLNQASTGTSITDAIGSANQTALSGTTVQTGTIPNWSETSGVVLGRVGVSNHPGRGPSRYARFVQTARATVLSATVTQQAVGQVAETDTAQAVGRLKSRAVGQAAETDTAQPVGRAKQRVVGQATETDTAQPVARTKTRLVGQAVETDLAQPITRSKSRAVGQATEVDTALGVGRQRTRVVGQATETDLAQPVSRRHSRVLGQASEADLAQPVTRLGSHQQAVGQASETDLAQPIRAVKQRTVGQAAETCVAQPIGRRRTRTLGQPAETDTAQSIARRKTRTVGQSTETDAALAVTRMGAAGSALEYWGTVV